jgi:hypothetical protein
VVGGLERIIANASEQISRKVVDKRFEPGALSQNDILGSFLKHGISREQAESEITISLYVPKNPRTFF